MRNISRRAQWLNAEDGSIEIGFAVSRIAIQLQWSGTHLWQVRQEGVHAVGAGAQQRVVTAVVESDVFEAGPKPEALLVLKGFVWIADHDADAVRKIRASNGQTAAIYGVGGSPTALATDGENIWALNPASGSLTKLLASTGASLGNFSAGDAPSSFVYDGSSLWVTSDANGTVLTLNPKDCKILARYQVADHASQIIFDKANLWVSDRSKIQVVKIRPSDGVVLATASTVGEGEAMAFDGHEPVGCRRLAHLRRQAGCNDRQNRGHVWTGSSTPVNSGNSVPTVTWRLKGAI
jgi:hypothetical protein